ncbi:MAG: YaaA family protein [Flavobacteriales bacterium]|nr:YaaA family protein [Flavobacteriales bacterium]
MLVLLSPAKDMDMTPVKGLGATTPEFMDATGAMVERLRKLSARQLANLMDLSPKLATLNQERFQQWGRGGAVKPAAWAFNGEVYKGLNAAGWKAADRTFAQDHLRILSGLYGALRPLDGVEAYRLEMGCGWSPAPRVKDLYAHWRKHVTTSLSAALDKAGGPVVDLASQEYTKAVDKAALGVPVITPVFKDRTPGGYRMLMLFAKRMRGRMGDAIVRQRLTNAEDLKDLVIDGYHYMPAWSTEHEWVFARDKRP